MQLVQSTYEDVFKPHAICNRKKLHRTALGIKQLTMVCWCLWVYEKMCAMTQGELESECFLASIVVRKRKLDSSKEM